MTESTEVTVREPGAMVAGNEVAALVPQTIEEAYRLASAMHVSGLAPRTLDTKEKVLVAIMAGAELGLAPFQATQAFAVINGRPSIWGDAMLAVVLKNAFKVDEWFDNDDAPTKAFCKVTRPDNGQVIERTYSVADAKAANLLGKTGPWQTNQKRMLQMRARAFALRDGASDVLKGFQMREEVQDYVTAEPVARTGVLARLAANTDARPEGFSAARAIEQAAEIEPATVDEILDGDFIPTHEAKITWNDMVTDATGTFATTESVADTPSEPQGSPPEAESFDALGWAAEANAHVLTLATPDAVTAWWKSPDVETKARTLNEESPAMAVALRSAVKAHRDSLKGDAT